MNKMACELLALVSGAGTYALSTLQLEMLPAYRYRVIFGFAPPFGATRKTGGGGGDTENIQLDSVTVTIKTN